MREAEARSGRLAWSSERRHAVIEGVEKPRVALRGAARSTTAVALSDVVAAGEAQLASSSLPLSSRVRV